MANEKIARAWFLKAERDLRLARIIYEDQPDLLEAALFHCQQAAEKSIKGLLAFHSIRFEKTHNLEKLIQQTEPIDSRIISLLIPAETLTRYAVSYRYPDMDQEEVSQQHVKQAIAIAARVYDETFSRLPFSVLRG